VLLQLSCVSSSSELLTGTVPFTLPAHSTGTTSSTVTVSKLSEIPTIAQLQLLKGADGKVLEIINHVAARWEDIAINMDFDPTGYMQSAIKANNHGNVAVCCKATFTTWLEGVGSKQPATWSMLIQILNECRFKVLAEDVKKALS